MKRIFLTSSLILFVVACATTDQNVNLYENYKAYNEVVTTQNVKEKASVYVTKNMLSSINLSHPLVSGEFIVLSRYVSREVGHHQKLVGEIGCLSVDGFNNAGEPIVLNIEYRHEDTWRINYIHVDYPDSSAAFKEDIQCPLQSG